MKHRTRYYPGVGETSFHKGIRLFCLTAILCAIFMLQASAEENRLKKCFLVASYHDDFQGQALKIAGALEVLEGKCDVKRFNMDTKRHPDPDFCRQQALEAKAQIESWRPDILIAIDDNASKYLIQPYFRKSDLPVVFSGIDWTAEEYGYPYSNATGMIEVFPMMPLIKQVQRIVPGANTAECIRGDRLSEQKDCERYQQVFKNFGIDVVDRPVRTFEEFTRVYTAAQKADLIILQNYSGIDGWDDELAKTFLLENSQTLTVSQVDWMAQFTMLAVTQVIEEQGEYAAEVALKILAGADTEDFPIISNRKWNLFVNQALLERSGVRLPPDLLRKAEKVD